MATYIVTGASRGIGRHIAERLLARGDTVIGMARRPEKSEPTTFELRQCDVGDPDSVAAAFKGLKKVEDLAGLINAAGVASMNMFITTPSRTMQRLVNTNLLGTMYCCQAVAKHLIRRGGGRIVNLTTIAVPVAIPGEAVYAASKAGVETFSRAFAKEVAGHDITVNCVAPGPIDTDMLAKVADSQIDAIVSHQIIRRRGTTDDVWNAVDLLLQPQASMITGEVLHVGGV